jgi:hypothetical protein
MTMIKAEGDRFLNGRASSGGSSSSLLKLVE